jgi:hypothetical protein
MKAWNSIKNFIKTTSVLLCGLFAFTVALITVDPHEGKNIFGLMNGKPTEWSPRLYQITSGNPTKGVVKKIYRDGDETRIQVLVSNDRTSFIRIAYSPRAVVVGEHVSLLGDYISKK